MLARAPQPAIGDERAGAWRSAAASEARRRAMPADEVLPPPGWPGMWSAADKHAVVAAVWSGQLRLSRARVAYGLSLEEFAEWFDLYRDGPKLSAVMVERRALMREVGQWFERGEAA